MKTLRSISTAVLFCLVLAAPAAANSTINLTVSSASAVLGTPVTYTVSGEARAGETYEVRIMHVGLPSTKCENATPESALVGHVESIAGEGSLHPFPTKSEETIPIKDYAEVGSYAMCAVIRGASSVENNGFVKSLASFTVVTPPPTVPLVPTPEAPPIAPTPVATPGVTTPSAVAPVALVKPSVVKPVAKRVSKLAKALKLCKKQKNKHKRAKCEKLAKRKYGSKIRR
jgi:hypothetical protein